MTQKELGKLLDKFKKDALKKFKAGRKEHNEDLSKLDFDTEMYKEMIDLLIYFLLKQKYGKKD